MVTDPNRVSVVEIGPPLDEKSVRSHYIIQFKFYWPTARQTSFNRRKFNWKYGDYVAMSKHFNTIEWHSALNNRLTQNSYTSFLDTFGAVADLFIKRRLPRLTQVKPPWWNQQISSLVRRLFIRKRIKRDVDRLARNHAALQQIHGEDEHY
ncbi:hypothetical protein BpHYR1_016441 [Brachionus plicatilis]|uniref:RNA-directed DNA polymerase from mobile element jockey-like n=1 Tax=Brachionus plicatilis TaxID=10195 RepID=A0A3M7PPE8_BRAPC|nr:hypothetical protein BpHYR1_016441 [Brachionus plicatilis]